MNKSGKYYVESKKKIFLKVKKLYYYIYGNS